MNDFKWLKLDGKVVAFSDGAAWVSRPGVGWETINSADAAMKGVSISKEEALKLDPLMGDLPSEAKPIWAT